MFEQYTISICRLASADTLRQPPSGVGAFEGVASLRLPASLLIRGDYLQTDHDSSIAVIARRAVADATLSGRGAA